MNVLVISTQNPFRTSGIVAYNLYKGLRENGINAKMLIKHFGEYNSADIVSMETSTDVVLKNLKTRVKRWMARLSLRKTISVDPNYHIQDYNQTTEYYTTRNVLKKIKFKPDAVIYLFQQNFLNAKNLYELNKLTGAKIFWYLMDTAALTGACHYSWDCKGYTKGCGTCPALYSSNENDQSAINFSFKQEYLRKTNLTIITPTEWQNRKAAESLLFKDKPIHKVLLSIDSAVFSYVQKHEGKRKLGIPVEKKVIFFGSTSVDHKRKGMKYLIDALKILDETEPKKSGNILLLVAGNFDDPQSLLPYESRNLGILENNEELASVYQAADVFVCPSIEDSGPMMINQAIMTGTPVVSFEMGVSEDLVITGQTGYRAQLRNSMDMAAGINFVLSLNEIDHETMCVNSRNLALSNCSYKVSTERIINLIQNESVHG